MSGLINQGPRVFHTPALASPAPATTLTPAQLSAPRADEVKEAYNMAAAPPARYLWNPSTLLWELQPAFLGQGAAPLGGTTQISSFRPVIANTDGSVYLRLGSVAPASMADPALLTRSDYVFLPAVHTDARSGSNHCDSGSVILYRNSGVSAFVRSGDGLLTDTVETFPSGYSTPSSDVVWTGTHFVTAASDAGLTSVSALRSTSGLTGSWSAVVVNAAASGGRAMRIGQSRLNPQHLCMLIADPATGFSVHTSTNGGANWSLKTSVGLGGGLSAARPACIGSGTTGRWVVTATVGGGSETVYTMPADFSGTFAVQAMPRKNMFLGQVHSNGTVMMAGKDQANVFRSVDGVTWDDYLYNRSSLGTFGNLGSLCVATGAFWMYLGIQQATSLPQAGALLRSTDGITWFQKNIDIINTDFTGYLGMFVTESERFVGGGGKPPSGGVSLANWNQATHVGTRLVTNAMDNYGGTSMGQAHPDTYIRIK